MPWGKRKGCSSRPREAGSRDSTPQHPPVRTHAALQAAVRGLAPGKKPLAMPKHESEEPGRRVAGRQQLPFELLNLNVRTVWYGPGPYPAAMQCMLAQGCVMSVLVFGSRTKPKR